MFFRKLIILLLSAALSAAWLSASAEDGELSQVPFTCQGGAFSAAPSPQLPALAQDRTSGKSESLKTASAGGAALHRGYRGMVEVGGGPGAGYYGDAAVIVSTSHGYQFGPYFFVGAGFALNRLNMYETAMYDFFADVRGYLNDSRITPSVGLKIGYSPFTTRNAGPYKRFANGGPGRQHGFFLAPSAGVNWAVGRRTGFSLTISDNIQRGRFYSDPTLVITPANAVTAPVEPHFINTVTFTLGFYW